MVKYKYFQPFANVDLPAVGTAGQTAGRVRWRLIIFFSFLKDKNDADRRQFG